MPVVLLVALLSTPPVVTAQEAPDLRVLYVPDADHSAHRHAAFEDFLEERFGAVDVGRAGHLDPEAVERADVVVLDWKQNVSEEGACRLGEREDWDTPTVLLGSAGLMLAKKWEVLGGSG